MRLFGFEFKRQTEPDPVPSFTPKESDDGAVVIAAGGAYGTYVDLDGTVRTEAELVTKYREMSLQPEIDSAIDEITNECIEITEADIVNINLDNVEISDKVKKAIREEFTNVLKLLQFNKYAYETFRRWYIDGRVYYHVLIDENDIKSGIKELRYVDPRKIRKVREVIKKKVPGGDSAAAVVPKIQNEYYIFNDKGFNYGNKTVGPSTTGLKIAKDSIVHVVSGLTDTQGTMVLSYLHKAIKALNQLRTLEDALVIYRLARAPERRIWYIDVGNLPKMKAEQYVRDIMVKHKNRLIYDGACLALNTEIPLLDGRTLTLENLIEEYNSGKENWVYSCDPITGAIVPGPISWAGITRSNERVMKLTLDNGETITCTLDHKFPVWNKGFVEAKDLQIGESMIPMYTREKSIASKNTKYQQIFDNEKKKWLYTHRIVSAWKDKHNISNEYIYEETYKNELKHTVHHINYNRYDNSPINLTRMNVKSSLKHINENVNIDEWKILNKNINARGRNDFDSIIHKDITRICVQKGFKGLREYRNSFEYRNHKIISIEMLSDRMDVGTLTIDKNNEYEGYHTFALAAGIFTKNSGEVRDDRKFMTMLEDYWLPRREGGRGTEVTTLPGGQTLGEMDDVLYFQKKLYQTLNVPVNRLNSDALFSLGRATEVTRDEVKFSKFITRLRSRFSVLFTQLLEKQLVLKGVMSIEDWNKISAEVKYDYAKDNYFTELKDTEILQNRAQLLMSFEQGSLLGKYYSYHWARRNILQQSDDDIEEMDKEIGEEMSSGDERWQPVDQQEDDEGADSESDAGDNDQSADASTSSDSGSSKGFSHEFEKAKSEKIKEAQSVVDRIGAMKPDLRTSKDLANYHSALQVIAKNK